MGIKRQSVVAWGGLSYEITGEDTSPITIMRHILPGTLIRNVTLWIRMPTSNAVNVLIGDDTETLINAPANTPGVHASITGAFYDDSLGVPRELRLALSGNAGANKGEFLLIVDYTRFEIL